MKKVFHANGNKQTIKPGVAILISDKTDSIELIGMAEFIGYQVSFHKVKGHWFDSWSGHMPQL